MQPPQLRREHSYFLPNTALKPGEKEVLMKYYKDEVRKLIKKSPYKSLNAVPKNSDQYKKMQALLETAEKYHFNLTTNRVLPVAYSDIPESDRHAIEALQISLARFVLRSEHPEEDPDVIGTTNKLRELYGKYGITLPNSNNNSPSYSSRRNNRSRKTRRGKKRRNTRNTRNA
jgi:uncharacterized protein YozE (UPF0346 family)